MLLLIAIGAATALLLSLILTPFVRARSIRLGFVDKPGHRKLHPNPIALGGGAAIFWAFVIPVLAALLMAWLIHSRDLTVATEEAKTHSAGAVAKTPAALIILAGATVLHIMGIWDDRRPLGPFTKLAIQLAVAVGVVLAAGVQLTLFLPGWIAVIITVLWIATVTNAFNFMDNMDGLSAGVGAICCLIIVTSAAMAGQLFVAGLGAILLGALLGFLRYNFHPATIFMGDGGSLVIGYLMGVLTIMTTYYGADMKVEWVVVFTPLIVLAIPLYDFVSVTLIRIRAGRSPFVGDQRHFSHRLLKRGFTQKTAALAIYLATAATGLGALLLRYLPGWPSVLLLAQTVMILGIIATLEFVGQNNQTD